MDEDSNKRDSEAEIEREVLRGRKFTPKEAMARMAGAGAMKGGSAIPRTRQAENEISAWLRDHLADTAGALRLVLNQQLQSSELLLANVDKPLNALSKHCGRLLASDYLLKELVRQADVEWGRRTDERPYFDRADSAPDPSDPYTVESVRKELQSLLDHLGAAQPRGG